LFRSGAKTPLIFNSLLPLNLPPYAALPNAIKKGRTASTNSASREFVDWGLEKN
jgi:hypothetical protein